jgi:hypothetical protein
LIEYDSDPARYTGTGVVFLAFIDGKYSGYWELEPDGPPTPLEPFPDSPSLADALGWARERTSKVLVRPMQDPDRYYWAGVGEPPNGWEHLPILQAE